MFKSFRIAAACVSIALVLPIVAQAVDVKDVIVRRVGVGPVQERYILNHVSIRPGQEFRPQVVARDVKDLLATERFAAVSVEYEQTDAGLVIVYVVENRLRLDRRVDFVGNHKFSTRRLRDLVGYTRGDFVDERLLAVKAQRIREEYRKKYYPNAHVQPRMQVVDSVAGLCTVTFEVTEGGKAKVNRFVFEGNEAVSDRELRGIIKRFRFYNPFSWWRRLKADTGELEVAREAIRQVYLERGHLDVRVATPVIGENAEGTPVMRFAIDEGVAYRVGRVDLKGVTLYPESELRETLTLERGQIAASGLIEANSMLLRDFYGSRGYINAQAIPRVDARPDVAEVDLVFKITEGELTHIRNVYVRGNTRTRDEVIRRELVVYPGERYDAVRVRSSESRLRNLGFFSKVTTVPEVVPGEDGMRDLVFEVDEKRTGSLMFGAGFSSIDNVIGFVELSQGNFDISGWPFTGDGQKLNLRAQFGSRRQDYSLSFTEPWFLDRKLSFGFDLFDRDREFEGYSVKRRGGALRLGKPIGKKTRIDTSYRIEKSKITDSTSTNAWFRENGDAFFFNTDQDAIKSSVELRWTLDTRDQFYTPTRGHKVVASAHLSGGVLGFDTDLYGAELRAEQFVPIWRSHVLAFKLRGEVVEEYGDTKELFLFDKLFAGGGRTIRGFDYREVGPKVVQYDAAGTVIDHRPIGGRTLTAISAEYIVPLTDGIRLAGFTDAGGVWEDVFDMDTDRYASSMGLELRFDIPSFPIRIYYAKPLRKDDALTELQEWGFWIGF